MSRQTKTGRHSLYGNQNGLPGLPRTSYVTRKPVRQPPRLAPQTTARPPPTRPPPTRQPPPPQPPLMPAGPDPFVTSRLDILEKKLNSYDHGLRALTDDLMRLQTDMKMQINKNEIGIREEREAKGRLEISMRQVQGHQYEMDERMRRSDETSKENRQALQQLQGHMQSIEKLINSIQLENNEKNSHGSNKFSEYKQEINRLGSEAEQLERYCSSLREDNRMTQNQLETVKQDLNSLQRNVKLQARLLEENAKAPKTPGLKPKDETGKMSETERMVLEGKMISLNNTIQDLSARLSSEAKKREKVENDVNSRLNEMMNEFGKTQLEKDKEFREVEDQLKEMQAGFSVAEKQRILNEINSVANDLKKMMDQKEAKLRNDTVNKLTVIEDTLKEENKRRQKEEQQLNEKVENQVRQMTAREKDSSTDLKTVFDKHEAQTRDRISELSTRQNNVEDAFRKHKMENERVITAEINQRENQTKVLDAKIDDLNHEFRMEQEKKEESFANMEAKLAALQEAGRKTGESKTKNSAEANAAAVRAAKESEERMKESEERMRKLQEMQEKNEQSIREQMANDLGDLDQRLQNVETSLRQQDEKLESQLQTAKDSDKEAQDLMGDKLHTEIEQINFKQKKLEKTVNDLKEQVQDTPKDIQKLKEDVDEVEEKLVKKIDHETKDRKEADEEIRDDIDRILGTRDSTVPSLAQVQSDVEATQTGMKKLAEAVHVVKSSLSERIKDEKKLREKETTILKRDVERLDTKYHDITERIKTGGVDDAEDDGFGF